VSAGVRRADQDFTGRARRGFELLDETGLLKEILPEIKALQGVEQPPEFHPEGDVWIHTLLMLEGLRIRRRRSR
jgi:poly(A) polymerase